MRGQPRTGWKPGWKEVLLLTVRTVLVFSIALQLNVLAGNFFSLLLTAFCIVAVTLAGVWLGRTALRIPAAFVLYSAAAALLYYLVRAVVLGVASFGRAGEDALLLLQTVDLHALPLGAAGALLFILTLRLTRSVRFASVEAGVWALATGLVFWSQTSGNLTVYAHPIYQAAAAVGILLLLLLYLGLSFASFQERVGGTKNQYKKKDKRRSLIFHPLVLLILLLLPLSLVVISMVVQRYNESAVTEGGGLMQPTLLRFDFSDYIKLESEISLSDDLVLLMKAEGSVGRRLLRRYVLSGYSPGEGFFVEEPPDGATVPAVNGAEAPEFEDPGYEGRSTLEQEYYYVNLDPESLVAMNYPVRRETLKNWNASSFNKIYRVTSKVAEVMPWELIDAPPPSLSADVLDYYTRYGQDGIIKDYAQSLTAEKGSEYEKVYAVYRHLRNDFFYSLKPGVAEDGNQLHHFLFQSKKGYCSYFAFSMALMVRSLGIPARVAVGFFLLPDSEVLGFYPVRADMAHAWVEVYFEDYGWIEFDPTTEQLAPGEVYAPSSLEAQEFSSLIEEILKNSNGEVLSGAPGTAEKGGVSRLLTGIGSFVAQYWYYLLIGGYLLSLLSVRLTRVVISRGGRFSDSLRVKAVVRRFSGTAAAYSMLPFNTETLSEYSSRLSDTHGVRAEKFLHTYSLLLFSPLENRPGADELLGHYEEFASSLKQQRTLFSRAWRQLLPGWWRRSLFSSRRGTGRRL